jgi:filamentous hemagglutinin
LSGNYTTTSADRITTVIGGDLKIESLKDKITYDSQQTSVGGGVSLCIPPICYGQMVVVNVNAAESTIKADHDSVAAAGEQRGQSGLKAGDGGFDVKVAGNTDLIGGVIASTAAAEKNTLTTGTLTFTDIANHSETEAHSDAVSLSSSMVSSGYGAAKGVAENLAAHAVASKSDDSVTRSAVSAGTLTITDQDAQTQDVALLSRDTANTHRGLALMDRQALQKEVEVRREIQSMTVKSVEFFTDEARRASFLEDAKMYRVERNPNGTIKVGEDGKPVLYELTSSEKMALKPEPGRKLNVFTNGIFNDTAAAGRYAVQMSERPPGEDVYLVYYPKADNAISELLVAGYQKFLEGGIGELTNATQEVKSLMEQYGTDGLNLIGYSRGAMTIGNAMESLAKQPGANGVLSDTEIKLVSPAYSAQEAANWLDLLSNGNHSSVLLQNHADDFVGSVIGSNPATYDQRPANSNRLYEWFRIIGDAPTVHSCGGSGAASSDCPNAYGAPVTIEVPSNRPNQNGGTR